MPDLRVAGVRKAFGKRVVLDGVDADVEEGRALALYGPSGCGKTTFLHILAGIERADAGEVHMDGQCVATGETWAPPEARPVGMVFQSLALWPHMSVRRHLDFVLKKAVPARGARRKRISRLLASFGLEDHARSRPARLSGGEQQRLALARAFATSPPLMLLDEPFSHLDEAWRSRMIDMVRNGKRQGASFVFATHDKEEVLSLADRVLVFGSGGAGALTPGEFEEAFIA